MIRNRVDRITFEQIEKIKNDFLHFANVASIMLHDAWLIVRPHYAICNLLRMYKSLIYRYIHIHIEHRNSYSSDARLNKLLLQREKNKCHVSFIF